MIKKFFRLFCVCIIAFSTLNNIVFADSSSDNSADVELTTETETTPVSGVSEINDFSVITM